MKFMFAAKLLQCYTAMKAMEAITQIPIEAITIIMHHKLSPM